MKKTDRICPLCSRPMTTITVTETHPMCNKQEKEQLNTPYTLVYHAYNLGKCDYTELYKL